MFDRLPQDDTPRPVFGPRPVSFSRPVPPAGEAVRLLAIPGGGMLGVVAAAFPERLERLGRAAPGPGYGPGYRLAQSFDLACGSSTGAVLATAVALGLPAERTITAPLPLRRAARGAALERPA